MYRTADGAWQHPSDVVPPGSRRDDATGAMLSPLTLDQHRDVWELQLRVRRKMAPVQLAFAVRLPGTRGGAAQPGQDPFVV